MMLNRLVAFFGLMLFMPLLIITVIISLIIQGPPIFFLQERIGKNFTKFKLFKFRSMLNFKGASITNYKDPRITSFGQVLRKAKIDELPQLIYIIKGDMNFVGPRPDNYHKILDVKLDLIYHYLGIKNIWIDFQIILITIISLFNPVWARSHISKNFLATLSPEIVKKMHLIRGLNNRCY